MIEQGVGFDKFGERDEEALKDLEPSILKVVKEHDSQPIYEKYTPLSIPISTNKLLPSVEQAPKLELKAFSPHLKYVFLGEEDTLPDIVSSSLNEQQEHKC